MAEIGGHPTEALPLTDEAAARLTESMEGLRDFRKEVEALPEDMQGMSVMEYLEWKYQQEYGAES